MKKLKCFVNRLFSLFRPFFESTLHLTNIASLILTFFFENQQADENHESFRMVSLEGAKSARFRTIPRVPWCLVVTAIELNQQRRVDIKLMFTAHFHANNSVSKARMHEGSVISSGATASRWEFSLE